MNKIIICLAVVVLLLYGCDGSDYTIKEEYKNGNIKCKIINYTDTSRTDTVIHYWGNGNIKTIKEYRKGLENCVHGWVLFYDSLDQILDSKDFYVNGVVRASYDFYPNGIVEIIAERVDGKQIGNTYLFNRKGELTDYLLFNFSQLKAFHKKYYQSKEPEIIFKQKELISQFYFSYINGEHVDYKDSLGLNNNYIYHVVIPNPPEYDRTVIFSLYNSNDDRINRLVDKDTTGALTYKFLLPYEGEYSLEVIADLKNRKNGKIVWADTLTHVLYSIR